MGKREIALEILRCINENNMSENLLEVGDAIVSLEDGADVEFDFTLSGALNVIIFFEGENPTVHYLSKRILSEIVSLEGEGDVRSFLKKIILTIDFVREVCSVLERLLPDDEKTFEEWKEEWGRMSLIDLGFFGENG